MDIKLFNTYTNQLELFIPIKPGEVSLYVCGPTVYNDVHIGNLRPVVVFDVLKRFLTSVGYRVRYVRNYTDIDDKIIEKAMKENLPESVIATRYIQAFETNVKSIASEIPDVTPKVTDHMNEIEHFIQDLITKKYAYFIDGDVYFRVRSIPNYGQLSKIQLDELRTGARVDIDQRKEDPLDFTLWKKTKQGIQFNSSFGSGRPGWHTECVVMVNSIFKQPTIDIHGGGFDLKFPHHENEIAQQEAMHHTHLANIWMHNGFVNLHDEKMSKSTGNLILAKDFLALHGGLVLRYLLLATHYRAPVNVSDTIVQNAQAEVNKILLAMRQASLQLQLSSIDISNHHAKAPEYFLTTLADDLNTANALTRVLESIKDLNEELRKKPFNLNSVSSVFFTLQAMLSILGLDLNLTILNADDKQLYANYLKAKELKQFNQSDAFRKILIDRHIL
jgi:cysteinyl-tRNA synthetase